MRFSEILSRNSDVLDRAVDAVTDTGIAYFKLVADVSVALYSTGVEVAQALPSVKADVEGYIKGRPGYQAAADAFAAAGLAEASYRKATKKKKEDPMPEAEEPTLN